MSGLERLRCSPPSTSGEIQISLVIMLASKALSSIQEFSCSINYMKANLRNIQTRFRSDVDLHSVAMFGAVTRPNYRIVPVFSHKAKMSKPFRGAFLGVFTFFFTSLQTPRRSHLTRPARPFLTVKGERRNRFISIVGAARAIKTPRKLLSDEIESFSAVSLSIVVFVAGDNVDSCETSRQRRPRAYKKLYCSDIATSEGVRLG